MNKELVIFYIKRHALVIVGLLLALGFVGYGFKFKGDAQARAEAAGSEFDTSKQNREKIYMPQDNVKIDQSNIDRIQREAERLNDLVKSAESVVGSGDSLVPFNNGIEFKRHLANVIRQLSLKARESGVELLRDPENKSMWKDLDYFFTFYEVMTKEHGVPENMMGELQVQLKDIETIMNVVLESRVQTLEMLQRNPITGLDFDAPSKRDFIDVKDRNKYTNSVAVIRPYRIKFRCLSGGIANVLSGLAEEDLFHVVRKIEVTRVNAGSAAGGMDGPGGGMMGGLGGGMGGPGGEMGGPGGPGGGMMGGPGGPGGPGGGFGAAGGAPGGGAPGGAAGAQASSGTVSVPLTAAEHQLLEAAIQLATPKAKRVMQEEQLEVTIDLDVIRKILSEPTPEEANQANGANGVNTGMPQTQPPGLSGVPTTNNPGNPVNPANPVTPANPANPGTTNTNSPSAPVAPAAGG